MGTEGGPWEARDRLSTLGGPALAPPHAHTHTQRTLRVLVSLGRRRSKSSQTDTLRPPPTPPQRPPNSTVCLESVPGAQSLWKATTRPSPCEREGKHGQGGGYLGGPTATGGEEGRASFFPIRTTCTSPPSGICVALEARPFACLVSGPSSSGVAHGYAPPCPRR